MSISIPDADYTPQLSGYTGQGAFRFWCQKVLPIVYDDSLSYYELLNKVVNYLNNVISDVASVEANVGELNDSYGLLQAYVNEHMQEIVSVVNQYTEYTDNYFNNLDVQEEIDNKLDEMASNGTLSTLIGPIVVATAPDVISQWLSEHITPTTPIVDDTLTISGAAADAKVTGDEIGGLKSAVIGEKGTPTETDCDDLTGNGVYSVNGTFSHIPADMTNNGVMITATSGPNTRTVQIITQYNTDKIWYRGIGNNGFMPWKKIAKEEEISAILSDMQDDMQDIDAELNDLSAIIGDTIKNDYLSVNFKYLYTEKYNGYYGGISEGKDIKLTADPGFVTYCFYSHANAGFYFNQEQTENPDASTNYISITVGHSPSGTWIDGAGIKTMTCASTERYRNINNNLPTVNNKLSASNCLICITVKPDMEFNIWAKDYELAGNVQNRRKSGLLKYDSTNSILKVFVPSKDGYIEYDFIHSVDADKNADVWRIDKAYAVNDALCLVKDLTISGEWECAIQLDGRTDFIGGILHGDEKIDSSGLTIIVDGEETAVNDIYDGMMFSHVHIAERCNMYDPNNPTSFVGYHGSEHVFNAIGTPQLTVYQYVYWAGSYQIDRAYLAMLPIAKTLSNKIWTDNGFSVKDISSQTTQTGTERVYLFTNGKEVGCEFTFSYTDKQNAGNKFFVTDNGRDDYNKCYFMIKNNTSVSSGDVWKTATTYNFDTP